MNEKELRAVLSKNIKILRDRRNWSQNVLAEKAELSTVYLSDIERGNKWPYIDKMIKIASALEIEVYDLLNPNIEKNTSKNPAIYDRYAAEANSILSSEIETLKKNVNKSLKKLRSSYYPNSKC